MSVSMKNQYLEIVCKRPGSIVLSCAQLSPALHGRLWARWWPSPWAAVGLGSTAGVCAQNVDSLPKLGSSVKWKKMSSAVFAAWIGSIRLSEAWSPVFPSWTDCVWVMYLMLNFPETLPAFIKGELVVLYHHADFCALIEWAQCLQGLTQIFFSSLALGLSPRLRGALEKYSSLMFSTFKKMKWEHTGKI